MSVAMQVAMVTGGAQGIGAGIPHMLAVEGAAVAICDLDQAQATETALSLEQQGRQAIAIQADVSNGESVRAAVDRVRSELGEIDVLVNNAGIDTSRGPVPSDSPASTRGAPGRRQSGRLPRELHHWPDDLGERRLDDGIVARGPDGLARERHGASAARAATRSSRAVAPAIQKKTSENTASPLMTKSA